MASSWNKGRAFLFLEAGRRVYRCQFTKNFTTIGRDRDNDIVIRDESVEPNHAQITRAGGVYTIRAMGEAEVCVDGEEVEGGWELMNGNRIEVGDTEILFAREQVEAPTTIHLLIRKPGEPPLGFWTSKTTLVIGREKGDIIIDDPLLSKVHAIIENFCDGGQFLLDARSERGTGLNGESIDARHRLEDGDLIEVGAIEVEFRSNPFPTQDGEDASKLAEERIGQLRAAGAFRKHQSDIASGGSGHAPRNPYQRYPSALPDADAPPDSRDESQPVGDDSEELEATARKPRPRRRPGRRRGLDLRSGVQTGIVDVGAARGRAAERRSAERAKPRRRAAAVSAPAPAAPSRVPSASGGRRPDPTYEPADLPSFKPRPHWGDPGKRAGFGERPNEMSTRLNRGNVDDSGLWYLPTHEEEGPPGTGRPVGKPIIRARGDQVPEAPPEEKRDDPRQAQPQRAMIRRKAGGGRATGQPQPMGPQRSTGPTPQERASKRVVPPARRPGEMNDAPIVPNAGAPGARPDEKERWYTPEEDRKPLRQRRGNAAWYLPDGTKKRRPSGDDYADEYGDRHERPEREEKQGSMTQVFDGEDY